MKVKNLNNSSRKTKSLIKKAFVELLYEKHELQYISVSELVKRIDITRSSFYNHYDNIYDVAKDFQDDALELLVRDDIKINSFNDVYDYIDMLTENIKENEDTYRMIISSNDQSYFFDKIKKVFVEKACDSLKEIINDKYLELEMNFFIDGVIQQLFNYFRVKNYYSIDELNLNTKNWFKKLFN